MTDLSPAAQAIVDEFEKSWILYGADPYECAIQPLGAALRAAADQVVPKEKVGDYVPGAPQAYALQRRATRQKLLAIAAELEGAGA